MAKIWVDYNIVKETKEVETTYNLSEIEEGIKFHSSMLADLEAKKTELLAIPNRPQK